ncbi:hypothetical protein [Leptolyngbya sp. 7M]|uniref:hypothetical protein n=1 Tax=Leptolyngbya sp. 7M TaxID=2812896 RepID=UPI001B8D2F3B|nr:hypothetical protein [Leptolyngbya sp. 7M]QYO66615.1 hypothetical protein JVX88_07380 [Leptolyngbya sp. 7M]
MQLLNIKVCFLFLLLVGIVSGQPTALTQQEFVSLLYTLEREPSSKPALVTALRERGIQFVLTDGLRSLTRTKSRNDDEVRRALEEADRRRRDPDVHEWNSDSARYSLSMSWRKSTRFPLRSSAISPSIRETSLGRPVLGVKNPRFFLFPTRESSENRPET